MFSKALFKQSCKANGLMWGIITAMVCFMLACVMLISGNGSVGDIAVGVTDTVVKQEIESAIKKNTLSYYAYSETGEEKFDTYYLQELDGEVTLTKAYYQQVGGWVQTLASTSGTGVPDCKGNISSMPAADTAHSAQVNLSALCTTWVNQQPVATDYETTEAYGAACQTWMDNFPASSYVVSLSATPAYTSALSDLSDYALTLAQTIQSTATKESLVYQQIIAPMMVTINPGNEFDTYYTAHDMSVPDGYDVAVLVTQYVAGTGDTYLLSQERISYRQDRGANGASVFLANMFVQDASKQAMISALSEYGITEERYDSYGYDFASINDIAHTTIVSYQAQLDYKVKLLKGQYEGGEITLAEYQSGVSSVHDEIYSKMTDSFLSGLPDEVSSAIEEIGEMDVYSLIVGSVYFKMAGLLLPIIYVIMASNSLISAQVDKGSMAYVLSTGTKRSTVLFTQIAYLVISLVAMCTCTMITSFICFSCVDLLKSSMTYGSLALMNLGSFVVLFAIGGLNFMTSCIFDRENKSMSIGGGLSIFFLVATMLGLFGSPQIPSVVRFDSLNYFNYVSIISLFDITSIVDGTTTFIWKLVILFVAGLACYVIGSEVFKKKDLPL